MKSKIVIFILIFIFSTQGLSTSSVVYGEADKIINLDPYTSQDAATKRLSDLIFDSLVTTSKSREYKPHIATNWVVEDQNTSITIKIRNDIYWHPTKNHPNKKLTVKDIIKTVKLLQSPKSKIPNKSRFISIKSMHAINDYEIKFIFHRAHTQPLNILSFKILPSHILNPVEYLHPNLAFSKNPIGTGPYLIEKYNKSGEILLKANNRYFLSPPRINMMVAKSFNDRSIMSQSLMYGAINMVTSVSPRNLPEILGDKNLNIAPYDALSFSFIAINTQRDHLKKLEFRRSLSHAINRKEMIDAFFNGKGTVISGPFAPTSWAYNLEVHPDKFNMDHAKSYLKSSGYMYHNNKLFYKNKKVKDLDFVIPIGGDSEIIKRISLALQGYFQSIGVDLKMSFVDWSVWRQKVLKDKNYDITIASWSFDDASNITSLFHSRSIKEWGNNFVGFYNKEVDLLLNEAEAANDFSKRRVIYHKLHKILAHQSPYLYLWTLKHHAAHHNKIRNVHIEPYAFFKHARSWSLK